MQSNSAVNVLAEMICSTIFKLVPRLPFDRTYQGRIQKIPSEDEDFNRRSRYYDVVISGVKYTAYAASDNDFLVNERVIVLAPQNDFANLIITGRRA